MVGSITGQAIALLLSVVVTRLYTPEMFASLEHFAMILGILSVFVGGRYEPAIMLPKKDEDARHILAFVLKLSFQAMVVLVILALFFGQHLSELLGNPSLGQHLWLVGPSAFFFVLTTALGFWFSRKKHFGPTAQSKAIFSLTSEPSKIGLAKMGLESSGLIYSVAFGHFITFTYLFFQFRKLTPAGFGGIDQAKRKELALEYQEYPKYSIPSSLLSRLAQWLHIALFGYLFGTNGLIAIGILGLCRRIVMTPLNTFGTSFSQVFYQRLTEIDNESLKVYYLNMLKRFSIIGIVMIAAVWVLPENTMSIVFGEEWSEVLIYLRVLVFWFAANFTVGSLAFILHRTRSQKTILRLDALHFVLVLIALLGVYFGGGNEFQALIAFVCMKVLYLTINVFVTLKNLSNTSA